MISSYSKTAVRKINFLLQRKDFKQICYIFNNVMEIAFEDKHAVVTSDGKVVWERVKCDSE